MGICLLCVSNGLVRFGRDRAAARSHAGSFLITPFLTRCNCSFPCSLSQACAGTSGDSAGALLWSEAASTAAAASAASPAGSFAACGAAPHFSSEDPEGGPADAHHQGAAGDDQGRGGIAIPSDVSAPLLSGGSKTLRHDVRHGEDGQHQRLHCQVRCGRVAAVLRKSSHP